MLVAKGDVHPVGALCSPWFRVQRVREACPRRLASAAPEASRHGWVGGSPSGRPRRDRHHQPRHRAAVQRITRRLRRTIGRLCCPIARTRVFVMRVVGDSGATRPRSRSAVLRGPGATRLRSLLLRYLAGTPPGLGTDEKRGTAGQQDGGPEAPTPHDLHVMHIPARSAASARWKQQNKAKAYSVAASLRKSRRRSYLKYRVDSAATDTYGGSYGNSGRTGMRKGERMV